MFVIQQCSDRFDSLVEKRICSHLDEIMRICPLILTHKWRDSVTHLSRHEKKLDLEQIILLHKGSVQDVAIDQS